MTPSYSLTIIQQVLLGVALCSLGILQTGLQGKGTGFGGKRKRKIKLLGQLVSAFLTRLGRAISVEVSGKKNETMSKRNNAQCGTVFAQQVPDPGFHL
jgi:hypothetical protein